MPFLISLDRFGALEAVIINKAMSLVVVMSALPFRAGTVSLETVASYWPVIANLLGGSLLGAWFGASWATRLRSATLCRIIAVLLVAMAVILMIGHGAEGNGRPLFDGPLQIGAGLAAGFAIGVVASLLGVARHGKRSAPTQKWRLSKGLAPECRFHSLPAIRPGVIRLIARETNLHDILHVDVLLLTAHRAQETELLYKAGYPH